MHHLPAWVRRFFESFPWTSQRLQAFIQSACFGEHTSEPDVEHDETGTIVDLGTISEDEEIPGAAVAEHKNVQMMSSTASSSSRRLLGKICSNVSAHMKWFRSQKMLPYFLFGPVGFYRCRTRPPQAAPASDDSIFRDIDCDMSPPLLQFPDDLCMTRQSEGYQRRVACWSQEDVASESGRDDPISESEPVPNAVSSSNSAVRGPLKAYVARSVHTNMAFAQFIMSLFACTWWNQDQTPVNLGFDVPSFGHV